MSDTLHRRAALGAVVLLGAAGLAACGGDDAPDGDGVAGGGATIALLLPESRTSRYEAFDRPLFEAKVAQLCPECTVVSYNASGEVAQQRRQVDAAIAEGASVVVLDPVAGAGAGGMVRSVQASGAQVIAYDRFVAGADYYMSFDNEAVGRMQAEALVEAMGGRGGILMLHGSPDDPNAAQFKKGARGVIDGSGVTVLEAGEFDNPDWSPENARSFVTDRLGTHDASQIRGVYAANDGQAGGVVAALIDGGVETDDLPPITGQDADLAAVQRVLAGEQAMTIYKPIPVEAEKAAEVAVALVTGEDVRTTTDYEGVPSFVFDPISVTAENVADTVVADEFHAVEDICTEEYAVACAEAGLS